MVDTIRVDGRWPLKPRIHEAVLRNVGTDDLADWHVTVIQQSHSAKDWVKTQTRLAHRKTGVKCWIGGGELQTIEGSLPRLLWGGNQQLVSDQEDLGRGFAQLKAVAGEIVGPFSWHGTRFTRLDLVWHIPVPPRRLLPVLRHARSPHVRRETIVYNTSAVVWPGSRVRITAYDKQLEMRRGPGDFTRLEVQIKKSATIQNFFGAINPDNIAFMDCWRIFRDFILSFNLPPIPVQHYSPASLIALCEHHHFAPTGISVGEWAGMSKTKRNRRRLERSVGRFLASLAGTDLAKFLPEQGPSGADAVDWIGTAADRGRAGASAPGRPGRQRKGKCPT